MNMSEEYLLNKIKELYQDGIIICLYKKYPSLYRNACLRAKALHMDMVGYFSLHGLKYIVSKARPAGKGKGAVEVRLMMKLKKQQERDTADLARLFKGSKVVSLYKYPALYRRIYNHSRKENKSVSEYLTGLRFDTSE